jgi:hypothetical protein
LVTWIGSGNYGTTLQAYALYEKIKRMGYSIYFLQVPSNAPFFTRCLNKLIKCFTKDKKDKLNDKVPVSLNIVKLNAFLSRSFTIEKPKFTWNLRNLVHKTDVFVAGSDQIWNVVYRFNPYMFLSFAGNKKRISYASSIGVSSIPEKHKNNVAKLLSKFSNIGVREKTAVKVLSDLTGRNDIKQVLDPTFLLTSDEWNEMADKATYEMSIPDDFILCYLIGNNDWYQKQLADVYASSGIKNIIIVPAVENIDFQLDGAIVYKNAGPREFVDLIRRARLVCTDSFHATAISLNYAVNFVEFIRFKESDKASQNSRIFDILSHFNLSYKIYNSVNKDWLKPIDYTQVHKVLNEDRKESLAYLSNAIEN